MSPALQAKLLRALAERSFERVGGLSTLEVDLRVVAATHRDLPERVREGRFREDLYYRLNVVPIAVPPLRERPGDIERLAELFLREKSADAGVPPRRLDAAARAQLLAYDFPGNVRELENLIERAVVLAEGEEIGPADLPLRSPAAPPPPLESLLGPGLDGAWARLQSLSRELERRLLERAMAAFPSLSNEEIARRLGTSRRVLEHRLAEHGLRKK
jgi:DNA-binding NtrC family response regulator